MLGYAFLCIAIFSGNLVLTWVPQVAACNVCNFLFSWGVGSPSSLAVDASGNVYVISGESVKKFTSSGVLITQWGSVGSGPGQFLGSSGIAVDSSGNAYVTDIYNYRVEKFTNTGVFITEWGSLGSGPGRFTTPRSIAVDSAGNVYVTDEGSNNRVQEFTSNGVFITSWGSFGYGNGQFDGPRGIAVDSSGDVYVSDYYWPSSGIGGRIEKFTSSGTYLSQWGSAGTDQSQFTHPQDVAIDSSGNVYVADFGNNRVEKFDPSGNFLLAKGCANAATQACPFSSANGQFDNPWGVAVGSTGNLFVTDQHNDRVEVFGDTTQPIPEYPLGLPILAIFMVVSYRLIKRGTRIRQNI